MSSASTGSTSTAGEGGVAALLGVGGADAHQAVDADLAAQHAVGVAALDLDGGLVEADALARAPGRAP